MCQTLAQGGKRCDTHKDGSKATVSLTSRIADVQEKIVRKVFGALKKEGKGLESPDREEVESYAETGKFLTKYNPDIPERQKKTIMNQFDKAKEEEPSGPLFHAWKHTLPETLRRTRKTMSAIGVAGAIMATSACGGGTGGTGLPASPSETPSSPSISQSATPSPSVEPGGTPGSSIKGILTKSELASNEKGQYIQTTIAETDPAMQYNSGVVDPSASTIFTPEDITKAQQTTMKFIAEETIDSSLNNSSDPAAVDQWFEKNKDKITPEYQAQFYDIMKSGDSSRPLVMRGEFREGRYDLAYSPTSTRVLTRDINITKVDGGIVQGEKIVRFAAKVNYSLGASVDGKVIPENSSADLVFNMKQDPAGKWVIVGYTNTISTTPVK